MAQNHERREATGNSGITIGLARSLDEIMACIAIRSAAFLARGEPYEEEFDGNDFIAATHIMARQDGTPVGTLRIRMLPKGVATWERLAILPSARRSSRVLISLANAAFDYMEHKGVRRAIGAVSDPKLIRFWQRYGCYVTNEKPVVYNGVTYTPMAQDFPVTGEQVGIRATQGCEADSFAIWLNANREKEVA